MQNAEDKGVVMKVIRAAAALMFFMNGLAGFLNGLEGKRSLDEFWAPLGVAIVGFFLVYLSRPSVQRHLSTRHQQWRQKTSSNRVQVVLLWFGSWLIMTLIAAVFSWMLTSQTELHNYQDLVEHGKVIQGQVTAKESQNHQLIRYTYKVNQRIHKGLSRTNEYSFENLKVGDKVRVCYNPANPQFSIIGNPRPALQNQIAFHVLIPIFCPIVMMLSRFKRLLPVYRRPLPDKAA